MNKCVSIFHALYTDKHIFFDYDYDIFPWALAENWEQVNK